MFAVERHRIIKNYLITENQVEVSTLSKLLNVSEVTVRRDLEKLEKEGFLYRTHGGAVLNQEDISEFNTPTLDKDLDLCEEIASIAIHMIDDNDVVMLTNGPINYQIAKKLAFKNNVTILTNDLLISVELSSNPANKIIMLGGDVDYSHKAVFGTITCANIENFFVNKVFIEVDGISKENHITVSSIEKASLIKKLISQSKEKIILCLAHSFDNAAFYKVTNIGIADKIVTNSTLSDEYKQYIYNKKIPLFTSINVFEGSV